MRYDRSGARRCFKFAPSEKTFGFALLRSDGRLQTFGGETGYAAPSTVNDRVTKVTASDGSFLYFEVTDTDGNKERYGAAGALLAKQSRQGVFQNFTYNAIGQPIRVTDSFDRSVTFAYSAANGQIVSAADQTGATVLFGYDTANNLTSVTYPGGSIKQYIYNEQTNTDGANLSGTLTGIIDENGTRYATYKYDSERRAISTEHAGGVEKYVASYTSAYGSRFVTDPLGTQRTYTFQNVEYVAKTTSITEACASCGGTRSLAIAYDLNGNVSSRGDFNGNKTCFDYDVSRNLETARVEGVVATADCAASLATPPNRPDALKTITTWHATYRLPLTITEVAAVSSVGGTAGTKITLFAYDTNGNLLQKDVTAPKNDDTSATELRTWKWTYNALGQVLTAKDPLNQTTTTVYYLATDTAVPPKFTKGDVQTVSNALSHVVTFNEYDKNGRLSKMTDANGLITTMTYHPRGWLTSRAVANGATTETTNYAYDNVGQLTRVTMPDGSVLNYAYDDAHRLVGMSDQATGASAAPNGNLRMQLANLTGNKIVYTLDNMGNRTGESNFDSTGAVQKAKTRIIDSLNRLQQDIGGTTYATAPTSAITQYGYDNNGNLTTTTDPLSRVTTNNYDALNRLTLVIDPYNGAAKPTTYLYDQANNLVRVTDPEGKATDYIYNGHNNLLTQTSPDTGATRFKYNGLGNINAKLDAAGRCSVTNYDALNRVATVKHFATSNATTNTQTGCVATTTAAAEEAVTYTYDNVTATGGGAGGKGRVTQITDLTGITNFTYDKNGRVLIKKQTLSSAAAINGGATNLVKSVTYAYNAAGQLSSMVTPSGQTVSYTYGAPASNSPGKVTHITVNGINVLTGTVYEPFGPNGGWSWGNHNGTTVINQHLRLFDLDYRPTAISSDPQGYNRNLVWDQANRITGIKIPGSTSPSITVPGVTNAFSLNQAFAYDQLDRITNFNAGVAGATTLATGMALLPSETFTYDGIGNRKTRTTQAPGVTSTQATSYTHTTGKHWLVSATGQVPDTWAYDATGNATYEANATLWAGYGSSGTTTSPIYSTSSVGSTSRALVYTFDGKNRPAKVAIAAANASQATTAAGANTVFYRFNALGQRVLKVGAGTFAYPTTIPFSGTLSNPPTQAQLQSLNTQNTVFYANSRFVYDEQGRLLGEYSKDGKLIQETVWFDDLPVAILKPKGASITNPLSGTGNIATNNQDANNTGANGNASPPAAPTSRVNVEIFYSHPDHLGTPRVVTASAPIAATTATGITSAQTINKAVWRWDSDPFASNATATSAPNENPNTLNQVVGTATLPYFFKFNGRFPGNTNDQETGKDQNYFRERDPNIGRYLQSDPIGLRGGISTYGYVRQNPVVSTDPYGLATYMCTAPLHALGGSGARSGPDIPGNLLYHQYLCVFDENGNLTCGGQDRSGGPFSPGKPSVDTFRKDSCEAVDKRSCVDRCVQAEITNPDRPYYALVGGGWRSNMMNCQQFADGVLYDCQRRCAGR